MRYFIEKGDVFLCVKDYVMEEGDVAYTSGKLYTSDNKKCITDNSLDVNHEMEGQGDFFEYFKPINN